MRSKLYLTLVENRYIDSSHKNKSPASKTSRWGLILELTLAIVANRRSLSTYSIIQVFEPHLSSGHSIAVWSIYLKIAVKSDAETA
ncbi:MAG: hypothetical protein V7K24_05495 [Nostoc sp.]